MTINSTILEFLDMNPEVNKVKYSLYDDMLVITKGGKTVEKKADKQ